MLTYARRLGRAALLLDLSCDSATWLRHARMIPFFSSPFFSLSLCVLCIPIFRSDTARREHLCLGRATSFDISSVKRIESCRDAICIKISEHTPMISVKLITEHSVGPRHREKLENTSLRKFRGKTLTFKHSDNCEIKRNSSLKISCYLSFLFF